MATFITVLGLGILISILGVINMTGNISSLHWYHRQRVTEENRKPFGKLVGLGTLIIGLAMIVFGTFLANSSFKNMFAKKEIYFVSFLRLVLIPLCMLGIFYVCGVRGSLLVAMIISASAPTATHTAMYAAKYENNTALGSEIAAQSSVLSIITMPVVVALASVLQ